MDGRIVRPDEHVVLVVVPGIGVDLEVPAEHHPEGFEDAAIEVAVVALVEEVHHGIAAHDDAHALLGVPREVLDELVVLLIVRNEHRLPERAEDIRPVQKVLFVDVALGFEVVEGDLEEELDVVLLHTLLLPEHGQPALHHVEVDPGDGPEAAADGEDVLLVQHVGGLQVAAVGGEDDRVGHAVLHQLEGQQPVVDPGKIRAVHLDGVNLDLVLVQLVVEAEQQVVGLLVQEMTAVDEVHAERADAGVLEQGVRLVETGVEHHGVRGLVGRRLEPDAEPAVALDRLVVVDRGDRVGEREEPLGGVHLPRETLLAEAVLVVQHLLHPGLAHIAARLLHAVDGVAEVLVVGADRLGDGAAGASGAEEVADDLLSGPDFGKGAVEVVVHVDPEGLLLGRQDDAVAVHGRG